MAIEGRKGNLRRLRLAHKLSQPELAEKAHTTKAMVSMIERGKSGSHMSVAVLKSLAKVFRCTIDELVK